jgi:sigma-B regulation protein RsbU (phosphoserine phosphatase)
MAVSPEPVRPAGATGSVRKTPPWSAALIGIAVALPVAVIISQIDRAAYRTGAIAVAFLGVLGLVVTWRAAAAATPVLLIGMWAQVTDEFGDRPSGSDAGGLLVFAVCCVVVVVALRRWERDRLRAQASAEALVRNERRLTALVDFAQQLAGVGDRTGVYRVIADDIAATTGANAALLVGRTRDRLEFLVRAGYDDRAFPSGMSSEDVLGGTPAVHALSLGSPLFITSAVELADRYPKLQRYRANMTHESWAAVPVPKIGALVLAWPNRQEFGRAQRAFVVTIGNLIGAAVQRVDDVARSHLERFAAAFDAMIDGVAIQRAIRDQMGRVIDFEIEYLNAAAVNLGQDRAQVVGRRLLETWPSMPLMERYADVLETGKPFELEDVETSDLGGSQQHSTIVSLKVTRLDPERLVLVIRDVSERASLVREIQDANRGFAVAQELARVGSWRYDYATDQLEFSDELYRICGMERGDELPRPSSGRLFHFEHPADRGRVMAAIAEAVEKKEPFSFDVRLIRQDDGEVRDTTTSGIVMTDERGEITAIWGATQDVTERQRAERVRREMVGQLVQQRMVVSELQKVLLPAQMPEISGATLAAHYRAANIDEAVGGDWYDAFTAPDGRVVMVVGDVAGHGIGCATLANQLRVTIRVRVSDGMRAGEILPLADNELTDDFATCWLGAYDAGTRLLTVANAGHLPAILLRDGSCSFVAGHTRPPLGSGVGKPEELTLQLEPADVLVVFTDGLVERRSESIEVGLSRLREAILEMGDGADPGLALISRLAVDAEDDVCVLTLRVGDNGSLV